MPHRASAPQSFQMHTVVVQPLSRFERGSISCRPMGLEPIQFEWSGGGDFNLDASMSEATNVSVGRYRVRAKDANGDRADVLVDVQPIFEDAVVVAEYRVRPASTRFSRDGEVEVIGSGFTASTRFLWTSGVETETPRLTDVPCGSYAVVAVSMGGSEGVEPVTVHRCPPARVGV